MPSSWQKMTWTCLPKKIETKKLTSAVVFYYIYSSIFSICFKIICIVQIPNNIKKIRLLVLNTFFSSYNTLSGRNSITTSHWKDHLQWQFALQVITFYLWNKKEIPLVFLTKQERIDIQSHKMKVKHNKRRIYMWICDRLWRVNDRRRKGRLTRLLLYIVLFSSSV